MTVRTGQLLLVGISFSILIQCKRNEMSDAASVPELQTAAATNITTTTATVGGTITRNVGASVTASGICWSKTNNNPAITDDTTKGTTSIGNFSFNLTGLDPDATYYVRAYAINSVGVGYGQTLNFRTANAAPEARNLALIGNAAVAVPLTVRFTYYDLENNPQAGTSFQWYVSNDSSGAAVNAIANATDSIYTPGYSNTAKFLRVQITPKASAGTSPGNSVMSSWTGPVAAQKPDTVNFVYNGQPVTYLTITSPVTGRKWLDRNLGAPNTPTGFNDWQNYGDLFQWGRAADGHQLINRAANSPTTTSVNGTTNVRAITDNPGHAMFITAAADPFNWRNPTNDNLWQAPARINNPCPAGFHVPTLDEWFDEALGALAPAFAQLKITAGGMRNASDGSFAFTTSDGLYWTSTSNNPGTWIAVQFNFALNNGPAYGQASMRAVGLSVRCIKD
jgi:hypothetical protein